jgi:malonyl CoA-acyl carrier protein transacylase
MSGLETGWTSTGLVPRQASAPAADRAVDRATADRATADRATADRATADRAAAGRRVLERGPRAQEAVPLRARGSRARHGADVSRLAAPPVEAFVLHGRDAASLAATASRIADLAPSLSDGELHDLACQLGQQDAPAGGVRAGLVAGGQRELAARARQAARLATALRPGEMVTRTGVFAGHTARGRVVLLFPGLGAGGEDACAPLFGLTDPMAVHPAILHASLSGLRWLDRLGVTACAAVGHSLGEIAGLVWAGCLPETEATRLVAQRSAVISASGARPTAMVSVAADLDTAVALAAGTGLAFAAYNGPRSHVLAGPAAGVREVTRRAADQGISAVVLDVSHAFHSPAMAGCVAPMRAILADVPLGPPKRRLVSTVTGREIGADEDIAGLLCSGLTAPVRFADALGQVASGADLLCETGPGHALAALAAAGCTVPAVSLETRTADDQGAARAAAALFAAGAVSSLRPLLAGREARPIDIWQERIIVFPRQPEAGPAGRPAEQAGVSEAGGSEAGGSEAGGSEVGVREAGVSEAGAAAGAPGRFLEDVVLHTPGTELIADSHLNPARDPYLADYRLDGVSMLPPVMALEAMAQVASELAGRPVRRAEQVRFDAPVTVRPGTVIRVWAKRAGERVTTVLRSQQDGQWADHCRATFRRPAAGSSPAVPAQAGPAGDTAPVTTAPGTTGPIIDVLDSADLYGQICFQSGRFRRVGFLPELTSRQCRALVRGDDDQPWFGPAVRGGSTPDRTGEKNTGKSGACSPLLLGSPGLNDATLHVLQACFPDRRVLPEACESVTVNGSQVRGAVEVRAVQRSATRAARRLPSLPSALHSGLAALTALATGSHGGGAHAAGTKAGPAGLPVAPPHPADEYVWDITAVDAAGQPVITWNGLRLRDAGPLTGNPALPPALLGAYLERGATALGLDPALRIAVRCEQPELPGETACNWLSAGSAPLRHPGWVSAHSKGPLDELSLRLKATSPAACAWETAGQGHDGPGAERDAGDPEFAAVRHRLRDHLAEPTPAVHARLRTAIECLSKAGWPVGCELVVEGCYDNGWALLRAGEAVIACTTVRVSGISCPVAVSIMTGTGVRAAGAA